MSAKKLHLDEEGYDQEGEQRIYADPEGWFEGERCPFCLASDGPQADGNGDFLSCFACGVQKLLPGDPGYDSLPAGRFFEV